jgi:tetratricopeptide (TPR) repeat protein
MADFLRGAHTAADQRYRQIVSVHPDDSEAWYMLGQTIQRKGHLLGRAWADARQPYERVLALDPQNAIAVWWLAAIAAREGRLRDLDSLTDRLLRLNPDPFWVVSARGQRAIELGDTAQEALYLAELRTRKDLWAQSSVGLVTYTTGNLSVGRRLWRLIAEPSRSRTMRLLAHTVLAKLEITAGRRLAAETELDTAATLDRGTALEHRAAFALTRFLHVPASELVALRASLERWKPPGPAIHRVIKLYLLGLLSARLGDEAAASRYADELDRGPRSTLADGFAADEAIAVRSEVAWMKGRREEALANLEDAGFWTNNSGLEERGDSPFPTHLHERFARAELLYELGRTEEALRWFRPLTYDFLYTAPAELRVAQIYQQKGDRRSARAHYTRFVELWADCDPDLHPKVHEAEQALAQLH